MKKIKKKKKKKRLKKKSKKIGKNNDRTKIGTESKNNEKIWARIKVELSVFL